jgi:hypothetical protein
VLVLDSVAELLMRFDPEQYLVHENAAGLDTPFEHEDDDEHEKEF